MTPQHHRTTRPSQVRNEKQMKQIATDLFQ